jgi:muramidase (phage lysozyme)
MLGQVHMSTISSLESALQSPMVQAFLELIGDAEGSDYNTLVGGRSFSDYSNHPGIYNAALNSTAAGKYQINGPTWREVTSNIPLPDFTPHSQDLAAVWLIDKQGAIPSINAGEISTAINLTRRRWASFPGAGYGQHERSLSWMLSTFNDELAGITNSGQLQVAGSPQTGDIPDIGLVGSVDIKAPADDILQSPFLWVAIGAAALLLLNRS